jgi:Flp pilus assembly protein TadD
LVKALMSVGRLDDALKEVDGVLKVEPFSAEAFHQKAHILERKGDVQRAEAAFRRSLECSPGNANYYRCLGILQYRTAGNNHEKLSAARESLEMAIEFGGDREKQQCQKYLKAIEMTRPPNRPAKKRRRPKWACAYS